MWCKINFQNEYFAREYATWCRRLILWMWSWQEKVRFNSWYCSSGWLSHQANSTLWAMWSPGVLYTEEDAGNQDWTNWRSRCVYACVQAALHGWADCYWGHKDCVGPWQIHRDGESLEIGQYLTSACRFAVCNDLFMMTLVAVECWRHTSWWKAVGIEMLPSAREAKWVDPTKYCWEVCKYLTVFGF